MSNVISGVQLPMNNNIQHMHEWLLLTHKHALHVRHVFRRTTADEHLNKTHARMGCISTYGRVIPNIVTNIHRVLLTAALTLALAGKH